MIKVEFDYTEDANGTVDYPGKGMDFYRKTSKIGDKVVGMYDGEVSDDPRLSLYVEPEPLKPIIDAKLFFMVIGEDAMDEMIDNETPSIKRAMKKFELTGMPLDLNKTKHQQFIDDLVSDNQIPSFTEATKTALYNL